MKDCKTIALIILSLFLLAAFCSTGDSYSQLYNPHGVKILSPTKEQEMPVNTQNFTVEGVSTDNSTNNCDVSLLLNGVTPYVKASARGQNGTDDFSAWDRLFNSNLHLNVGENKLTARLLCSDDNSNQISKYHSVNFTGINETSSFPITKVLNSPSTREDISPTNISEIVGSKSSSSDLDNQPEVVKGDEVVRSLTSGPVIIPPSESQASSTPEPSPVDDSVIIPNATNSSSALDNVTSRSVVIPPHENISLSGSLAPVDNPSNGLPDPPSGKVVQQQESKIEGDDDIPLIFPTPSPRVTSDGTRDKSVLDTPVQDLSPVVKVEKNNTEVEEGSLVILNAAQSYSHDGPIESNVWRQLTSHPIEFLEGLNMPILKFKAPNVSEDTPLEFEISVSDTHGKSNNGVVHVLVSDIVDTDSKANSPPNSQNQTISEPPVGSFPTNIKIPDQSNSNVLVSPRTLDDISTQSKNQSQKTDATNSSENGSVNGTSMKAMAGVDQIVNEGMEVILKGDSTSTNTSQGVSYEWRQVGGDVKVTLGQQNSQQINFHAPEVNKDSKLTFKFIASTDSGQVSSDEVNIVINDIPENLENNESNDSQNNDSSDNDDDDDDS
ncbi:MAG: PKD domain-containing protein [Nitrososphaeraceae archaeon]